MKSFLFLLRLVIILFTFFSSPYLKAYNLRQVSSRNGLSNSAVLRIYQDTKKTMWIGTYDGLNLYNGINIHTYKPTGQKNSLSGNIIRNIIETEEDVFWILTNLGLDKLDRGTGHIKSFPGNKVHMIDKNHIGDVFSILNMDSIGIYNKKDDIFYYFPLNHPYKEIVKCFSFDSNNILWILDGRGFINRYQIDTEDSKITSVKNLNPFDFPEVVISAFSCNDKLFILGDNGSLSEIDRKNETIRFIKNIKTETDKYGIISGILADDNDILISFNTNGVLRLYPNSIGEYEIEKIDLDCGVFSMYKDEYQKIVWFATDGQGAIIYSKDNHSFKSETFNLYYDKINKPVRGVFLDKKNDLWIGTKGDGVLRRKNYNNTGRILLNDLSVYKMENSELVNNSVFTFAPSNRNLFWIGSDGFGLNYYSYKTNKIHKLKSNTKTNIKYIQSIYQQNDTTLWLGSSGEGLMKLTLEYKGDFPEIKRFENKNFFENNNRYYSVISENDSILWIGSRINGAVRYNTKSEEYDIIRLKEESERLMNDILCVFKDSKSIIWLGTSLGLIKLISYDKNKIAYENYNESDGLPNNSIHGILEGEDGILWLSTNNGVVEFNSETETFSRVNGKNGIDVIEFSDNAYYNHSKDRILFFGGINGLVSIALGENEKRIFEPDISFNGLKIYGNEVNMNQYMKDKKGTTTLEVPYEKNFFSISFIAIDYINGTNYMYEYQLENFSDQWINNGISNTASFTNIPPGNYILHVRYKNTHLKQESDVYSLNIKIAPPYYRTTIAYLIYFIISTLFCIVIIKLVRKWYRMRKNMVINEMKQEQKEMIYESQFRFFTNVTHELCTPLTLIQGPCEKIIDCSHKDPYTQKYALVIQRNVIKLNSLINDLIDFRRLESGNKEVKISEVALSEETLNLCDAFIDLAESKKIKYDVEILQDIMWHTDSSCYSTIVTNLISNAFKYTFDEGYIGIRLYIEDDSIIFKVSNSGKGIKEKDIPKVFDRYRILNSFGMPACKGVLTRNGLGLAICDNMIKLLKGSIEVTSIPNEVTIFKAIFPTLESDDNKTVEIQEILEPTLFKEDNPLTNVDFSLFDKSKPIILLVDDEDEMLWFLTQIFIDKYNVIPIRDSTQVIDFLKNNKVNLIIMDIMMPSIDGISLTRKIKSDRLMLHIPLILLSAKGNDESLISGIDSGAEMYITKPFNTEYLEKVVSRLISRDKELKEYYNSSLSVFELEDGKFIHNEDKAFYEKLLSIIETNVSNPNLSVKMLSQSLGISSRHFYRRLKDITDVTPYELIKEYRLRQAEKFLVSTNLSIDEIIYKVGFTNRGSFFRLFSQRHEMTPKKYRENNINVINRHIH